MNYIEKDLTLREMAVLECLTGGKSTADTAQVLSVRECTVKYHVRNIIRKLGAMNRTHAVAIAMAAGIIAETKQGFVRKSTGRFAS
mgnify:CR=1 FL=1